MILARDEPNSKNTSGKVYYDYEKTDFRINGCVVGPVRGRNIQKLAKNLGSTVFKKYKISAWINPVLD